MSKRRTGAPPQTGWVRIISGQYRGRRLSVVDADGLRPTSDRLRETLFNWLQNEVPGARVLDAFAGTGALGFEAASRYAEAVTLVEIEPRVADTLEQSRATLQAEQVRVVRQSFAGFAAGCCERFDVVFLDPPFQHTDFHRVLGDAERVVAPGGSVYLECPVDLSTSDELIPEHWSVRRDKRFGDVRARLCVT